MSLVPANVNFEEFASFIGEQESQNIQWGNHWKAKVVDRAKHGKIIRGAKLPWQHTHGTFRARPAELTIVAGYSGHRKSMFIGMVMLWLARTQKVCIASMEMEPEATLLRMAGQAAGCKPSANFAGLFADWAADRICIYNQLDTVKAEKILGMVSYAAKVLGCGHIVVDSLTKCGFGTDDYNAQKEFVDKLSFMSKALGIHIWLIAHMRKTQDETRRGTKFDIAGGADITNLADNVIICFKNKDMETVYKKHQRQEKLSEKEAGLLEKGFPEQIIEVAKQRHGDWEGQYPLWFHPDSLQFTNSIRARPLPFSIDEPKDDGIPF